MSNQTLHFEPINLPEALCADLYKNSLVLIDTGHTRAADKQHSQIQEEPAPVHSHPTAAVSPVPASPSADANAGLNWLGNFEKKILVVVDEIDTLHISPDSLELLSKMLQALSLSLADVAVVNAAQQFITQDKLNTQLPATAALYFGIEPETIGLPMRLPHFQVREWNNCRFLFSPSLKEINTPSDKQKIFKQQLWASLQQIFKY